MSGINTANIKLVVNQTILIKIRPHFSLCCVDTPGEDDPQSCTRLISASL